jgi:hypothetical protein
LIFWSAALLTRQSATAAVAMNMSEPGACASVAANISRAERTSMRDPPRGVARLTGPLTSVTWAPASRAALATA